MNKPSLLARMLGRSKHPVVASLAGAVLNRPLLVHQTMGEDLISAYLHGQTTSADTVLSVDRVTLGMEAIEPVAAGAEDELAEAVLQDQPASQIGVINISGGLVNRPMPGPSGGGPISYVAIRDSFDQLMDDPAVRAVVLRIESPGGMCSGCFDLVDHIYGRRGEKPIHALVDDYAYSAAYGIASAADKVWVSRTGGTGSVGVVGYHVDWSEYNAKQGAKVTAIYAGAKKIAFSPHFPLSDEAREEEQLAINALYSLFTTTVARNRGLDVSAVIDTQAGTFDGQGALDIGFADALGTWDDVMAELAMDVAPPSAAGDPAADEQEEDAAAVPVPAAAAAEPKPTAAQLDADFQAAVLASSLASDLVVALQRRGRRDQLAAEALAYAGTVRDLCAAAGFPLLAGDFIQNNADVGAVRTQLIDAKAAGQAEIVTALPADAAKQGPASVADLLNPSLIYQNRRK